jgi:hypothetical protein
VKSEKGRNEKSDEGAPREVVHDGADDRVDGYSFEQGCAAGDDDQAHDEHGADDGYDLLDAPLARADPGDMAGDGRAAVGTYAGALDDHVGLAAGAFDFRSERHRGAGPTAAVRGYEVRPRLAR